MDILSALVAGIAFGALTTVIALVLRRGIDPAKSAVVLVLNAFALSVLLALVAIATGDGGDADGLWRYAVAGLVAPGLATISYSHAIGAVGASRVGIMIATAPVVSAVLAVALLDEPVELALVCAALLIAGGGVLLAWEGERPSRPRAIGFALAALTALFFAIQAILTRWAAEGGDANPLLAVAVLTGGGALVMSAYWMLRRLGSPRQLLTSARVLLPAAVLYVVAYVGFVSAYERARVTVVSPLTATEALWTVFFAALLIGRVKDAIGWRVLAATVLVVAGTLLVTVFS